MELQRRTRRRAAKAEGSPRQSEGERQRTTTAEVGDVVKSDAKTARASSPAAPRDESGAAGRVSWFFTSQWVR